MKALIVGGTSGLGLELAKKFKGQFDVFITGRNNPNIDGLTFLSFDIKGVESLAADVEEVLRRTGDIDLFIYAAGFYQEGTIADLSDEDILCMNAVGLVSPALFLNRILKQQKTLLGFISITSTSQWTPRLKEPMYNAVKGGLGMLTAAVSLDPKITKTMLVGPAGMKTNFWSKTKQDQSEYMDPEWVAEQVFIHWKEDYEYKYIRILRQPPRVEVMETRLEKGI
jgi:NAD(P)-dependent dehydrogenase (short-subunit alcohol dehydrogenase family)